MSFLFEAILTVVAKRLKRISNCAGKKKLTQTVVSERLFPLHLSNEQLYNQTRSLSGVIVRPQVVIGLNYCSIELATQASCS